MNDEKRISPNYNVEAENLVIQAIFLDDVTGDMLGEISKIVKTHRYFSQGAARDIYEAAQSVLVAGNPLDFLHVLDELTRTGKLERLGGPGVLAEKIEIQDFIPYPSALGAARLVADCYHKRLGLQVFQTAVQNFADSNGDTQTVLGQEIDRLAAFCKFLGGEQGQATFDLLSLADVLALPEKEWLVDSIIGKGDLGMIFGQQETGKTFVALDLLCCAAVGGAWCGRFQIGEPLRVAYCTAEGAGGIPQRLKASVGWYNDRTGLLAQNVKVVLDVPQLFAPDSPKNVKAFIRDCKRQLGAGIDLLFIDTLHNATVGSNENDQGDAAVVIAAAREIRDALACAVIFCHHANRSGTGYRGSSAYAADMDVMLEISGHENPRKMKCYKAKDADHFDDIYFQLRSVGGSGSVVAEWLSDRVPVGRETHKARLLAEMQAQPGQFLTSRQWAEAIGLTTQTQANPLLAQLTEAGNIQKRLRDAAKTNSKNNPWVYGIVSNHDNDYDEKHCK